MIRTIFRKNSSKRFDNLYKIYHTLTFFVFEIIRGTDNGDHVRRRDGGWRSKSLRIGHTVKVSAQCTLHTMQVSLRDRLLVGTTRAALR